MRKKSWGQNKKSLFDKIIEDFRFKNIDPLIKNESTVLDLGCGYDGELLFHLRDRIKTGIGIDLVVKDVIDTKIKLLRQDINTKIDIPSNSIDYVTLLAVIEHVYDPTSLLNEIRRILKKGGHLIITTPNIRWRRLLELMAKLRIISKKEIDDHKVYYSPKTVISCLSSNGFEKKNIKISKYPLNNIFDFVILAIIQK